MDLTKIKPLHTRAVVRYIDSGIDSPSRIIYIPEKFRRNHQVVKVLSISDKGREKVSDMVQAGDYVLIEKEITGFKQIDPDTGLEVLNIDTGVILAKVEGYKED